ncbi:MAG: tetratricopeptide repeat protein [Bacteroidales bacterium]|nr:tetratricopeptide repeat protein [Bacteroidales bacterium]
MQNLKWRIPMKHGFDEEEEYIRELLERFEASLHTGGFTFFDSNELEDIIYHYFSAADFPKAFQAIRHALDRFPTDITFEVFQAQYLMNTGEPQKALANLDRLKKRDPRNPDIMLTRASILGSMNRHEEAIREYIKALDHIDDDKEEIYTGIAFEYESIGNYEKAVEYLKQALYIEAGNETLLYEIGYCYDLGGMSEQAAEFFESIVDKNPYSDVAWYNLGLAYTALELFEKAIDAFDFCIAIDPSFTPAYFNKAQAYEQMERYPEAIAVYKSTLEFEKPDAMVWYYLGDCYERLEKYETALENYRKSVNMEKQFSDAWMGMGICFSELDQKAEAIVHMKQAVKLEPENPEYWIILADTLMDDGQYQEAEAAFIKVTELDPYHQEIWLDYSEFFIQAHSNYSKALEIIEEGTYFQPQNALLSFRRVAYLLESGYEKEAVRELYIALSQDYDGFLSLLEYSEKARLSSAINDAIQQFKE